ncbi:MAG: hypothetical protein ACRC3B_06160 [Bacteroidia bacterium]
MRSILLLFLLLSIPAIAKRSPAEQLLKNSAHVVQIRVCDAQGFPYRKTEPFADVYRVVIQEIYKSDGLKIGDTIAVSAALFTMATDTLGRPYFSNMLNPGTVLVAFFDKSAPKTYSYNKSTYKTYKVADEMLGLQLYSIKLHVWLNENTGKRGKKKKQ